MVVLMPLGATLKGGGGYTVDFGIDDYDKFVDESLAKLGITASGDPPGSVYLSAHSGGGITISALSKHPFHKYRFGGIFAFESFHAFDIEKWRGSPRITSARTWPSCSGCEPTATTSTRSPPPRRRSCATGAFGWSHSVASAATPAACDRCGPRSSTGSPTTTAS